MIIVTTSTPEVLTNLGGSPSSLFPVRHRLEELNKEEMMVVLESYKVFTNQEVLLEALTLLPRRIPIKKLLLMIKTARLKLGDVGLLPALMTTEEDTASTSQQRPVPLALFRQVLHEYSIRGSRGGIADASGGEPIETYFGATIHI
jgi:hypothetical protein